MELDISQELLTRIAVNASPVREGDTTTLTLQLGRVPRGLVGIGARCACGRPAVTITQPRLAHGEPFPTLFYLTLPYVVKEISHLEGEGVMAEYNELLKGSESLQAEYAKAHRIYIERRNLLGEVPEIKDFSAGGMPNRIKCLHALAGYSLSVGKGVCPFGDMALERIDWDPSVCHCE
ncbi:DUF501 domain-containing protein [Actinotignum urinale]|uniref:DUF501 domain-containing protein n=1 Tax=Actinotignum urinale TaxID=190146 RepID=UPI00280AD23A|nr:DUF501 domain-containing protein [Actinotignum urinale]MDY5128662.1 DUF501 domain-containing protein [Actinotignum urinale]